MESLYILLLQREVHREHGRAGVLGQGEETIFDHLSNLSDS